MVRLEIEISFEGNTIKYIFTFQYGQIRNIQGDDIIAIDY